MNIEYKIRAMSNKNKVSDTLPRKGLVNEVCKEWVVYEDEALAYKLQKQEVEEHLSGNKTRNAQVREDFPKAKYEQQKEIENATRSYQQMLQQQAEVDSLYAKRLAEKWEKKEKERKQITEKCDAELIKCSRNHERAKHSKQRINGYAQSVNVDVNELGIPVVESGGIQDSPVSNQPSFTVMHDLRRLRITDSLESSNLRDEQLGSSHTSCNSKITASRKQLSADDNTVLDEDLQSELGRHLQEEKDAELAKMLQEQEKNIASGRVIDRDKMMAIEMQDMEFAKLLQEREKAKLKRAKERAKQRALLKKQQADTSDVGNASAFVENGHTTTSEGEENVASSGINVSTPASQHSHTWNASTSLQNVAVAIDPTYNQRNSVSSCSSLSSHFQYNERNVPPYMPMQGQRRQSSSLDKKQKKDKSKDGCKQQ